MTKQQAINVMEKYTVKGIGIGKPVIEAHNMAIVALESQQWIPVSERLPEMEDGYAYVMVIMDDGFVCTTAYTVGDNGFELWEDSGEVVAWMPLPEPYQPDQLTFSILETITKLTTGWREKQK